jgi:hypothetical protein
LRRSHMRSITPAVAPFQAHCSQSAFVALPICSLAFLSSDPLQPARTSLCCRGMCFHEPNHCLRSCVVSRRVLAHPGLTGLQSNLELHNSWLPAFTCYVTSGVYGCNRHHCRRLMSLSCICAVMTLHGCPRSFPTRARRPSSAIALLYSLQVPVPAALCPASCGRHLLLRCRPAQQYCSGSKCGTM